ncbi:MAG: Gfo/Idh/MocA family oxidoreductase [Candidatus Bathyarchaeota archaeon]|nr:MAG: Gfo/Idh/MocA family oxidoreductase [Candidatus Bathyarchaeota archaeon]
MEDVRIVLYGVGAMGTRIAKLLLKKKGIEIVGVIDIDEEKVGKDLGEALATNKHLGIKVSDNPENVLSIANADVVIHSTTSFLKQTYPQIATAIKHGANVVSTCEELSYPYATEPELARELDKLAREHSVSILGTGINPGFLMDTLVITLTSLCQEIEQIKAARVMNAATRRASFQKKIGAGLTVNEFREGMKKKTITGHVGLTQSISMIADALKWRLRKIEADPAKPVIAKTYAESEIAKVEPGQVAGIRQCARGIKGKREVISLDFQAYIGVKEEYDAITIRGVPNIHERITPCTHGDLGTVAIIVNYIAKIMNARPGLATMIDLPVPSATIEDMRNYF